MIYTVVGYDKDNDVYIPFECTQYEDKAKKIADYFLELIKKGELRNEENDGEPIDCVFIFADWGTDSERMVDVYEL